MELKTGYKQTEVGVIPSDWDVSKIQDLIDNKSIISHLDGNHGALYPRSSEFIDYGVPYIGANDFVGGLVSFSNCKFLSIERANQFRKGIAKNGDVLFAHNATVGPVAFLKTQLDFVILSTTATYFRCNKEKLDNQFLLYALQAQTFISQYSAVMAQSTRFQVPITAQRKLSLVIPTLAEQTAIATALSDTDQYITHLEKLIAKKRNIKQGAMQELLKPKEGWVVKKLGEIAEIKDGTHQTPKYVEIGVPFYSVENVTRNDFVNTKFISQEEHTFLTKNYKIERGDILMTRIGSIGDCKYVDWEVDASFYVSLALLKIKSGFSASFISHYSKSEFFQKEIELNSLQSAIPKKINLGQISKVGLFIPISEEKQTRIATILSDMDSEIATLETKLSKAQSIKQGMMQQLLTGKIRLI